MSSILASKFEICREREYYTHIMSFTEKLGIIANIQEKLEGGNQIIKLGHKIQDINPNGIEMEIPLTQGQIERRLLEIRNLKKKMNLPIDDEDYPDYVRKARKNRLTGATGSGE